MRVLVFFLLVASTLAQLTPDVVLKILLAGRYGGSSSGRRCHYILTQSGPRRRCPRRNNNNLLPLALLATIPAPTPPPTGCFSDAMNVERKTETGSEMVSVANLTGGNYVKCLKAPQGPRTATPAMGWCKFVARGHNSDSSALYNQLFFFDGNGKERMLAATPDHLIWKSTNRTLAGTIHPSNISLENSMFVPISSVSSGDVIVFEHEGQWEYRTVSKVQEERMSGLRNPRFADGGLPIVNGVLATTSAVSFRGGHWGGYFQYIWNQDWKFFTTDTFEESRKHPLDLAQRNGTRQVDLECLLDRLQEETAKGVDVTNYNSYHEFAEAYLYACEKTRAIQA